MSVNWTKEQQKVIDYRNRNILVSAAAGSGKTAVLVERIIKRITDPEHPVDIDRLLVVTFTKAAASEMRERIGEAIDQIREENPENSNLERQLTLIHNAQITTIDSFCLFVVRNHFQEINLDPNFRIADTGEIQLLELDVLDELFEKNYSKPDNEAFLQLIDAYSGKRSDQAVKDMVTKIYKLSASNPWPKEWIAKLVESYQVKDEKELLQTEVIRETTEYVRAILADGKRRLEALKPLALAEDGPTNYFENLEQDIALLDKVEEAQDYVAMGQFLEQCAMGNLKPIRNFTGDGAKKERVQEERKQVKSSIAELKKRYFGMTPEALVEQLGRMKPMVEELVRLTLEYVSLLEQKKSEKQIVDFSDVEHYALNILVDEHTKEARATAEEFQASFEEIMIDEYQDSNQVQEEIMCAISRMQRGEYNMFMVGDVKQSIYRFRLARPELFMGKYIAYDVEESKQQRIDLHQNFRSRREVVDAVNDIFYKIMQTDLGNVAYDSDAALYCGAQYPEASDMEAEILLLDTQDEMLSDMEDLNTKQVEARLVADKIRRMMKTQMVTDKKTRELRPMRYSDIVILFRSLRGWGTDFAQVLEQSGIPAHVESSTGYFSAMEVQTVLSMLKILDNPYQDIPMAAVLRSPMAGLDNEELAEIHVNYPKLSFAAAAIASCRKAQDGKLQEFWKTYTSLRKLVEDTPIHELIQQILDTTGYGNYVAALPAGEKRAANLAMLLEKAIAYENTSYKGLFHFVRYIDQLQKYDVDFGEADVIGENEDVVHIMTIHKSKGLEFPVVFVSGINKGFNQMDVRETMVVHPDLGLGLTEMQASPRIKRACILREEIANRMNRENLGEELRVLYVALTRAKEKLILTGTVKDAAKTLGKYVGASLPGQALSFVQRASAKSYMEWIIPAALSYPGKYDINFVSPMELVVEEAQAAASLRLEQEEVLAKIRNAANQLVEEIESSFQYEYPYQGEAGQKSKYSVSELKHDSMVQQYERTEEGIETPEFLQIEKEPYIPEFMRSLEEKMNVEGDLAAEAGSKTERGKSESGKAENCKSERGKSKAQNAFSGVQANQGALRGTAVHRVMECLDFAAICQLDRQDEEAVAEFVENQLTRMLEKGKITQDMAELVLPSMIASFVRSDVAYRMGKAQELGNLFREKPFVMDYNGVLLQGIIDVFWLEENRIILLDYKTDHVKEGQELVLRYKTQLELYANALSRVFSADNNEKSAEECLIYSFRLQEVIRV